MWAEAQVGAIKTQKEKYMQNTPTFIDFVLDETGSMSKQPTIEGFNDFIKEQKAEKIFGNKKKYCIQH